MMRVKEVANLVGISVRTLHHYDEIGLLKPATITGSGYRIYSNENLENLQQILFFRELGFPLKKIKEIMYRPSFDRIEALELQRQMLQKKRARVDQMIQTIDKTIKHSKGEMNMTTEEKFKGFDFSHNPYEQEARDRFGDEAVERSQAKMRKMLEGERKVFEEEFNEIYKDLAKIRHESPGSDVAQAEIKRWYEYLNKMGNYSLEAFKGLGQMYVSDERFTKNIDQFGEGLAVFMCDAMAIFADQ